MIRRFPREECLHAKGDPHAFSMNDVYLGLRLLAKGKRIGPRRMVLLCRWFNLNIVNKPMARQILHQLRTAGCKIHVRFPREKQ